MSQSVVDAEIDGGMDDFEEEYGEEDLMDDEIDDVHMAAPSSSKSLGRINRSGKSLPGDSYHSDPEEDNRKTGRHKVDRHGRNSQRRPPRPSASASGGRKPKVQGGGSMHRRRTTRRVAAAEKQWGNSSMPAISVRDIMGSEKRATAVGMTASGHSPRQPGSPGPGKDSKSGAEEKRAMIRSKWNEKRSRQSDVKSSLAQFLIEGQSEESEGEFYEEPEDEELISDVEDEDNAEVHRPTSSQSLNLHRHDESDEEKSIKSTKSHSRSQRRRRSITKGTDGNATDGDVGDSSHSRSRKPRRRIKQSIGADDDDRSVGSTKSARSRRGPRRPSRHKGEDSGAARRRQSGGGGPVDGDQMRRGREADEGQKKKSKSMSTRRKPEINGASAKPRSTRRKVAAGDDDDRSIGSRKSAGARRRRQPAQRTKKHPSKTHEENAQQPLKPSSTSKLNANSPPVSPLSSKPNSAQSVTESPSRGEDKDKLASLSKHLEANPKIKVAADPEERSEESSRFSGSYEQPTSILQFDPTNTNNVTLVKQDKANVTSARFKHSDGTESEFHISEVAGLPTFETVQSELDRSQHSDVSEPGRRPRSTNSLGSVEYGSDYDNTNASKSMSHLGYNGKADPAAHNTGKIQESGANQSGRSGRGIAKANSAGRRAFLNRMRKPERNEKPPRNPSHEHSTFQESVKTFFGAWNKKGECEDGEDDEDQQKGNRFFRKREEVEHQALDDVGSDEE